MQQNNTLVQSFFISFKIIAVIWIFFLLDIIIGIILQYDITNFGIIPRTITHLPGIILMPVLHVNIVHLGSNSMTLFVIIAMLFYIYPQISKKVFIQSWILTGTFVWIFADLIGHRSGIHVGASGLVYSLVTFLFFIGIFSRQLVPLTLSIIVVVLYSSLFLGVIPMFVRYNVSWESHLIGALVGLMIAWQNKNSTIYQKTD